MEKKEVPSLIEVKHLTKRYGDHTAVSDLTFSVEEGQVYGFLGPNGAGKSTTMNIMTGCLAATSGEVTIGGYDIFEDAKQAKRLIGYLPEQPPLYLDRTPWEYLTFVARAKGIPQKEIEGQIGKAMEATGIGHVAHRLIKNLSKGTSSGWASPRPCWATPRSSSWTSPPWAWTPGRSSRSGT